MSQAMTITHIYSGTTTVDGEPSPFTGLGVEFIDFMGMGQSGYDSLIRLDCTAEELAARYSSADPNHGTYTEADMREFHGYLEPGELFAECCLADDLTPIAR